MIRTRRTEPRPGRLKGDDLTALRWACFNRDHRRCTECGMQVVWKEGHSNSMHMAHIGNKRNHGDSLDNVTTMCPDCHLANEHNCGGHPCPPKPIMEEQSSEQ